MKLKSIRIENFRSFLDETITLNPYSCFVGPNGVGKSSVLAALNVFFREQAPSVDPSKLTEEDYFYKDTTKPIRITVTFGVLVEAARSQLVDYVRQEQLVATAEAHFDSSIGFGTVKQLGYRSGVPEFRAFFDAASRAAKVADLSATFQNLQTEFPDLRNAHTKDGMGDALREYESAHPETCVLVPSEENFYGPNGTGKLASFIQWIYVPAVKDAGEEAQESKNTALEKLVARAVDARTSIDTDLKSLKAETQRSYQELLERCQVSLTEISQALQARLGIWAHPNVRLEMEWRSDPARSVVLQSPVAGIKTGDGAFLGSLARMGHGLQRSYLLALLLELASSDRLDAPTLILGCEEPELYQHPPQARHLAEVFSELSIRNNQVIVTTHSPLFVSGNGFENVRLVRPVGSPVSSAVKSLTFESLCDRIRGARGEDRQRPIEGLVAKIHQALQPGIAEMFFARVPVLVEGLEDVSYITTVLHQCEAWTKFRRLGCHIIPVNGKDKLIQPLAMAAELELPVFIVFDSDGDATNDEHRRKHERDNCALMKLLGLPEDPFPAANILGQNHAIWATNLTRTVKADFGDADYSRIVEATRLNYAQEKGLEKNDLFIAEWVSAAYKERLGSRTLENLCEAILGFAAKGT